MWSRLTFMMLDAGIVAVSPSSVWRVLSQTGLLSKWNGKPSKKGTGFAQPLAAHQHWHIDVSYLNIGGTFYYLCSVLDGYSRYIVNWDIRESMTEADIEILLQPRSLRSCLADGDSFENFLLDPLGKEDDSLLVARGAERASCAKSSRWTRRRHGPGWRRRRNSVAEFRLPPAIPP